MKKIIVEISPLWELKYTGVPNVVYEFVLRAINCSDIDYIFTVFGKIIPKNIVNSALNERSGALIRDFLGNSLSCSNEYTSLLSRDQIPFLFTNTCNLSTFGSPQGQIIYDLSYFSFADYHTAENIAYHVNNFESNILKNSINFCISDATRFELNYLFGNKNNINAITIPLGPNILSEDQQHTLESSAYLDPNFSFLAKQSRYFLFISTIEPRKNLDIIFSALSQDPKLFGGHSFVVVGRDGWNISWDQLINKYHLQNLVDNNTIIRVAYITEDQKFLLLKNCEALIYPSCYEGFGLPVLEALSLEVPVIASCASSIPEVAGPNCLYFDPYSIDSFSKAVSLFMSNDYVFNPSLTNSWISKFSYQDMYDVIEKNMRSL